MGNLESHKTQVGTHYAEIPISGLKNPDKYKGKKKILELRSSWEGAVVVYLDNNSNILEWSSEEVIIPYFNPVKNRNARYFVDFWCKYKTPSGIKQALLEIKPHKDTIKPVLTEKMKDSSKIYAMNTFYVNQAKWHSARNFCKSKGWNFIILTEHHLVFNIRDN